MAKLTPTDIANKQVQRAKAAQGDYVKGVQAVTSSPAQAAIAQQDKMRTKVLEAIDSGKWADNLGAISLESWKSSAVAKAANFSKGVSDALPDIIAFHAEFQPFVQQVSNNIRSLPSTTDADMENRMLENMRQIKQFKRSNRRR